MGNNLKYVDVFNDRGPLIAVRKQSVAPGEPGVPDQSGGVVRWCGRNV